MEAKKPVPSQNNKFLNQADPNTTSMSMQSVNSVNLERINQRNAERLAKLENNDFIDDSAMLTMNSIKSRARMPSRHSGLLTASPSRD